VGIVVEFERTLLYAKPPHKFVLYSQVVGPALELLEDRTLELLATLLELLATLLELLAKLELLRTEDELELLPT